MASIELSAFGVEIGPAIELLDVFDAVAGLSFGATLGTALIAELDTFVIFYVYQG